MSCNTPILNALFRNYFDVAVTNTDQADKSSLEKELKIWRQEVNYYINHQQALKKVEFESFFNKENKLKGGVCNLFQKHLLYSMECS